MEVDVNDWYTGYVMSRQEPYLFFVIIEEGISAVITTELQKSYEMKLGDFASVKIRRRLDAKPHWRAKHSVVTYRPLAPLASSRIALDGHITDVLIKTTARYDTSVSYGKKAVKRFKNETFGNFFDLDDIIEDGASEVVFEFKSKSSPADRFLSIFVPVKVFEYLSFQQKKSRINTTKSPISIEKPISDVNGFVGFKSNSAYSVWTSNFGEVSLPFSYSAIHESLIGRWVSMTIEKTKSNSFRVCQPVVVIDDLMPTRIKNGVAEVFISFRYSGNSFKEYPIFYNPTVGDIMDVSNIVVDLHKGKMYQGWILRQKRNDTDIGWRVSSMQRFISGEFETKKICTGWEFRPPRETKNEVVEYLSSDGEDNEQSFKSLRGGDTFEKRNGQRNHVDNINGSSFMSDNSTNTRASMRNEEKSGSKTSTFILSKENKKMKSLLSKFIRDRNVEREMRSFDIDAYKELEDILS